MKTLEGQGGSRLAQITHPGRAEPESKHRLPAWPASSGQGGPRSVTAPVRMQVFSVLSVRWEMGVWASTSVTLGIDSFLTHSAYAITSPQEAHSFRSKRYWCFNPSPFREMGPQGPCPSAADGRAAAPAVPRGEGLLVPRRSCLECSSALTRHSGFSCFLKRLCCSFQCQIGGRDHKLWLPSLKSLRTCSA